MASKKESSQKAWVVSIRMGLGHQRAAFALKPLAEGGEVINVGEPDTSNEDELKLWNKLKTGYETLSKLKTFPLIGNTLFNILNAILYIAPFYPLRDLSKPTLQVKIIRGYVEKGLGTKMMEKVNSKPLPMITTYPVPSIAADFHNHSRNYCLVTDAEISRAWVPMDPSTSKTFYFAPCSRALYRLKEYGVKDEKIFLTGFPLPKQLLGTEKLEILLPDVGQRLHYLDPEDRFWPLHGNNVEYFLGKKNIAFKKKRKFTILYAVGGAGALWEYGLAIARSLKKKIMSGEVRYAIAPGVRSEINDNFVRGLKDLKIPAHLVPLIHSADTQEYFEMFTQFLRETDVLWTKPSELVFYAGLGMPLIMTEPVGPQEGYNLKWCQEIQAGISQEDPAYADEWLFDLHKLGRLAESAWDGFLKARKFGIFKIEEVLRTGTMIWEKSPLRR